MLLSTWQIQLNSLKSKVQFKNTEIKLQMNQLLLTYQALDNLFEL